MKTETDNKAVISAGPKADASFTIVRDLLDVTWRMAVPTVVGLAIGYGVGTLIGYRTAGFLIGAAVGFAAGLYLALRLLKSVKELSR